MILLSRFFLWYFLNCVVNVYCEIEKCEYLFLTIQAGAELKYEFQYFFDTTRTWDFK